MADTSTSAWAPLPARRSATAWVPTASRDELTASARDARSARMMRAWARCIAYDSERATRDELTQARAAFGALSLDGLGHVDMVCLDMVTRELAWRDEDAREGEL